MPKLCIVCGTQLPDSAIRLEQIPELQEKVARDLSKPPDDVDPQESICVPCWRRIEGLKPPEEEETTGSSAAKNALKFGIPIAAAVGATATVIAAPLVVAGLGFGAGGIAAGSAAASMMSASATTGIGAGLVATLQSIGAAGFSAAGFTTLATAGGTVGGAIGGLVAKFGFGSKKKPPPDNPANGNTDAKISGDDDDEAPGGSTDAEKASEDVPAEPAREGSPLRSNRPIQETGDGKADQDSDKEDKV